MKISQPLVLSVALALMLPSCANSEKLNQQKSVGLPDAAKVCLNVPGKNSPCRPNLHLLFSSPVRFRGVEVSFFAFAAYSPRGSLLIYPSSSFACDSLEYSAFETFLSDHLSAEVRNEIEENGVSRVFVVGRVSDSDNPGAMPVIGRIDKASVLLARGAELVLRKNPKGLGADNDDTFFGKTARPSCLSIGSH